MIHLPLWRCRWSKNCENFTYRAGIEETILKNFACGAMLYIPKGFGTFQEGTFFYRIPTSRGVHGEIAEI